MSTTTNMSPKTRSVTDRWGSVGLISGSALLFIAALVIAWQFVQPAPTRILTIATGSADGAYHRYAERYREILAGDGIDLRVVETAGSVENLTLLFRNEDPVDLAFVQGGVASPAQRARLNGLGSLFYEPLWLIGTTNAVDVPLNALGGMRIGVGQEQSGTRVLALELLSANSIGTQNAKLVSEDLASSIDALCQGRLDLAFAVTAPQSPALSRLPEGCNARLLSLPRAAAYARRDRALTALELPAGALDPARNLPDQALSLIAATANLVAHPSLHPALADLLINALHQVHGEGDLLAEPGTFPSPEHSDFPLDPDAKRYYTNGPPFLQRYLPFWAATWVDRLKIMVLPLVGLLLPLVKVLPPIYRWRIRRRIYRWYLQLRSVDLAMQSAELATTDIDRLRVQVDEIESKAAVAEVPLSYTDQLYNLRLHIRMLQRKLDDLRPTA